MYEHLINNPELAKLSGFVTGDGHLQIKDWRYLTSFLPASGWPPLYLTPLLIGRPSQQAQRYSYTIDPYCNKECLPIQYGHAHQE